MAIHHFRLVRSWSALLFVGGLVGTALLSPAAAGPLVRRMEERQACQEFASKLQQSGGNPAAAQQVYQQGVLQLVARFGENPCGDIPAPTASGTAAPIATPAVPSATTTPGPATSPGETPSVQQLQACQQFASKLQAASASGGAAAAKQTYTMGLERLTGMFGSNPCPSVRPPQ